MHFASEEEREERLKVVGDYKHGSVCRIKLHNFLTYKDVEFCPGPRLNMVVGPNGTGKSTILCAICLGLGGEPKLLGRASAIETFIMNGQSEGSIEIELTNTSRGESNAVIRRVLRHQEKNNSNFFLNDHPVSAKKVRELVLNDFGISVDNLCTFLPQDRVGSFSGFNPQDLLIETEKSLSASQHLHKTHLDLIRAQDELRSGHTNVASVEEKLERVKTEFARLEREKERMEQRQLAIDQRDLLKKKLAWMRFDRARHDLLETKKNKNEAKRLWEEAKADLKPLEDYHNQAIEEYREINTQYTVLDQNVKACKEELKKYARKYECHDDHIEQALSELAAIDDEREQMVQKEAQARERLANLKEQFANFPSHADIIAEFEAAKADRQEIAPRYDAARRELRRAEESRREKEEARHHSEAKYKRMEDDKARRQERIFMQQPKLRQAYEWIDANRQLFRKPVCGPIVCEITTESETIASYLEHHVPNSTLKSFVVQHKADYDLLYNKVRREMKIPVNIITVKGDGPQPNSVRMYSNERMEMLKRDHGVSGFMDEGFDAPEPVQQALRSTAQVHRVLIGDEKTQESLNRGLLEELSKKDNAPSSKQGFTIFSCERGNAYRYTGKVSQYGNRNLSTVVDDVKQARQLAPGVSEEDKQRSHAEFEKCKEEEANAHAACDKVKADKEQLEIETQSIQQRLNSAKGNLESFNKFSSKVSNAERKLRDCEEKLAMDHGAGKDSKVAEVKRRLSIAISALEAHAINHKKMMEATFSCAGIRIQKDKAAANERRARQAKAEKEEEHRGLEALVKQAAETYKRDRHNLVQLKKKAEDEAPIYDADNNDLPLKDELEALPMDSIEEGEAALEDAESKINEIIADPNVIRQYHDREREIESLSQQLDDLLQSKDDKKKELEQKQIPWETALTNSIQKVDVKFTEYMSQLGCAGEIALTKGDTEDGQEGSFKDWGVEIRVSFRESTKLQVLSARVQSGGERSVSTIMYLMALQDMMVAPFRCVDEINQGLDDRNERLVFHRIVENSTRVPGQDGPTDHSGQYFLITPKLLPNLTDMEVEAMTVLCIFNGPFSFRNPQDWNVPKLLDMRRSVDKENNDANQNEEDEETIDDESTRGAPPPKRVRRAL